VTPLGVTPIPLTLTVLEPTTKLAPFKVTPIVAPAAPEGELMEVSVGMAPDTVNVTPLLVPSGVVTVIVRAPIDAAPEMERIIDKDVDPNTWTDPTPMPEPLMLTVVEPTRKPLPVKPTNRVWPCCPDDGSIAVRVGAATAAFTKMASTGMKHKRIRNCRNRDLKRYLLMFDRKQ